MEVNAHVAKTLSELEVIVYHFSHHPLHLVCARNVQRTRPTQTTSPSMPPRRQPLSELPLSHFVVAENRDNDQNTPSSSTSRPSSLPDHLLSPPKRRILAAEGLVSPIKSPSKRVLFRSVTVGNATGGEMMEGQSMTERVLLARNAFSEDATTTTRLASGPDTTPAAAASSSSSLLAQTGATHKSSASQPVTPAQPRTTRSRSRALQPSPELVQSPMNDSSMNMIIDTPARPTSLKRLRTTTSPSSTSSAQPPTPKRRNVNVNANTEEEDTYDDQQPSDKENVPPPPKKTKLKGSSNKGPLLSKGTLGSVKEKEALMLPTSRGSAKRGGRSSVGEHLSPEVLRARRAILEAEVDDSGF